MLFAPLLLACMGSVERYNARPLEPYMNAMLEHSGSRIVVDRCQMVENSRAARCTLIGKEADAEAFVSSIRKDPVSGRVPGGNCQGSGYLQGWSVDPTKIPPNQDNIQVNYVFRSLGRVCIDLEFPFG
jgi:hypothetical protein